MLPRKMARDSVRPSPAIDGGWRMAEKHPDDKAREEEARRTLERVAVDSEIVGQSTLARTVNRARAHMAAEDAEAEDRVEVWGRRVGRGLSVVAFVVLAIWLVGYLSR